MQVLSWESFTALPPSFVALGYFDGGHIGHRALLEKTVAAARAEGFSATIFSFDALPTKGDALLSTKEERLAFFAEMGIDFAVLAPFSSVRGLSPMEFVKDVLQKRCSAQKAFCGFNYLFGAGASGDAMLLCKLLPGSEVLPPTLYEGEAVSATRIRAALLAGDIPLANAMLGTPYSVSGVVSHGKGLGGTLGFPTANIAPATLLPRFGVYRTRVTVGGRIYNALTDVGIRPTAEGGGEARTETFLRNFEGNLYGESISVSFLRFLREERRFDSLDALKTQISLDMKTLCED